MTKGTYLRTEEIKNRTSKSLKGKFRDKDNPNYRHGGADTRLYNIWRGVIQRCFNENNPSYPNYGSRDIYVEDVSWFDFVPFRDWALANGYADSLTIDRIDNNEGYSPDNCRWITLADNVRNRPPRKQNARILKR
jgi:hypothetical protein